MSVLLPESRHADRLSSVRRAMAADAVDALLVSASADLFYLTGLAIAPTQRLVMLVVPAHGPATLVLPDFEAVRLGRPAAFDCRTYADGADAMSLAVAALPAGAGLVVAAAADLPARLLLEVDQRARPRQWLAAGPLIDPVRLRKDDDELRALARAAEHADSAVESLLAGGLTGHSERDLARRLDRELAAEGFLPASIGALIAAGPGSADLRHRMTDEPIGPGTAVLIDLSGAIDGYCADLTRTVLTEGGTPDPDFARVYETVRQAGESLVAAAAPGVAAAGLDRAARERFAADGFGAFVAHRVGHGVGLQLHEGPDLDRDSPIVLAEGMTFSVQPGLYLPGRFGIRIEDTARVTATGTERFNAVPRELRTVR